MATATKSQQKKSGQNDQSAKPAFTCRHRRLQVAVWQNESSKGTFFSASMQRSYKKEGEDWQRTQATLNRDDLLVTAKLLNWAHSAVMTAVSTEATPSTANRPVSNQRYRNLEAAVWRHEGDQGPFFTVSIKRSYKVEDQWNESVISLSNDDLLPMARLLDRTHDAIDDLYEEGDFSLTDPASDESSNVSETQF
jgi:hypothetical protein